MRNVMLLAALDDLKRKRQQRTKWQNSSFERKAQGLAVKLYEQAAAAQQAQAGAEAHKSNGNTRR